jgi:hypothetical protein
MRGVSPAYLKDKTFSLPGRGFLATVFALLAALGAVGAWLLVAYEWRVGCEGVGGRVAPASGSRQAFRCADLGQRDARYFFAVLSIIGVILVGFAARRWMFGKLSNALMVAVVIVPIALPYVGYLVVTRPSDECDKLGQADMKAAVNTWKDDGKKGPRPDFCNRV